MKPILIIRLNIILLLIPIDANAQIVIFKHNYNEATPNNDKLKQPREFYKIRGFLSIPI